MSWFILFTTTINVVFAPCLTSAASFLPGFNFSLFTGCYFNGVIAASLYMVAFLAQPRTTSSTQHAAPLLRFRETSLLAPGTLLLYFTPAAFCTDWTPYPLTFCDDFPSRSEPVSPRDVMAYVSVTTILPVILFYWPFPTLNQCSRRSGSTSDCWPFGKTCWQCRWYGLFFFIAYF